MLPGAVNGLVYDLGLLDKQRRLLASNVPLKISVVSGRLLGWHGGRAAGAGVVCQEPSKTSKPPPSMALLISCLGIATSDKKGRLIVQVDGLINPLR